EDDDDEEEVVSSSSSSINNNRDARSIRKSTKDDTNKNYNKS
ncbi:13147_t:CDS:1, partial [Racocetra persica]